MRDLCLAALFFAALPFAVWRPWIGVLLLSWIGYMNPHRLCYGFAFQFPFVAIATGATVIGIVFSGDRRRLVWTRETMVLVLFILWMSVTTLFALNAAGAQDEWIRVLKIQAIIFITLKVMTDRWRIHALVWVIAASLALYGVKGGLFAIATGGNYMVSGPPGSFITGNNEVALALVMVLPLLWYLQLQTQSRIVRLGVLAVMAATVLAVLATYSRGGFLALASILILLTLKSRRRFWFITLGAALIPLALAFMPERWETRMHSIRTYEEDASSRGRINAWHFAYNLASDRPLTGGGFGTFTKPLFMIYAPDPLDHHDAHSIYFELLGEHGYPGLLLFLTLAVLTWRSASWVVRSARGKPELRWAGDLAAMCQVSLAGYAVGGAFAGLAYFDLPYHLMSLIAITKVLVRTEMATGADEAESTAEADRNLEAAGAY